MQHACYLADTIDMALRSLSFKRRVVEPSRV